MRWCLLGLIAACANNSGGGSDSPYARDCEQFCASGDPEDACGVAGDCTRDCTEALDGLEVACATCLLRSDDSYGPDGDGRNQDCGYAVAGITSCPDDCG